MTDHIDALERLQKLRESGAITDAEFETEKARLMAPPPAPPAASYPPPGFPPPPQGFAPPPLPEPATRSSMAPWLWIGGTAIVILVGVVVFLLVGRNDARDDVTGNVAAANTAAPANVAVAAPEAPTMRSRAAAEQLASASQAVFGRTGAIRRNIDGQPGSETPKRVIWTDFGPILLTESAIPDGCHACAGFVGAYYLRDTGAGFEVASRYPEAAPGAGWGAPPQDWTIVDRFTTYPALYSEGGYMGQGYASSSATIVEFRPEGPSVSSIDLGSDNIGAVGEGPEAMTLEGRIANVVKNRSFDVVYTGSCTVTRRYIFRNNTFVPQDDQEVRCPGQEG